MNARELNSTYFFAKYKQEESILTIKYKSQNLEFEVDGEDYWNSIIIEGQFFDINLYCEKNLDTGHIVHKSLNIYGVLESGKMNTSDYLDISLEIV